MQISVCVRYISSIVCAVRLITRYTARARARVRGGVSWGGGGVSRVCRRALSALTIKPQKGAVGVRSVCRVRRARAARVSALSRCRAAHAGREFGPPPPLITSIVISEIQSTAGFSHTAPPLIAPATRHRWF